MPACTSRANLISFVSMNPGAYLALSLPTVLGMVPHCYPLLLFHCLTMLSRRCAQSFMLPFRGCISITMRLRHCQIISACSFLSSGNDMGLAPLNMHEVCFLVVVVD